jgi:hypothetical protein
MEHELSTTGKKLNRKFSYAIVLCGLAAGGCAVGQGTGAGTQTMRGPVEIQVVAAAANPPSSTWKCGPPSGAFKICVSDEPIDLTGDPPARSVPWRITTNGWTFVPGTGITLNNHPGWSVQPAAPTNWVAHGQKDGTTIKYTINVTNGTAPPVSWDPRIINN